MGTRADFYLGRGVDAEWLGSIAWDGYPQGIDRAVLSARTKPAFTRAVESFFVDRKDVTRPDQGWPWPWDDSRTTDYAYAFDGGRVWAACFGHEWFDPRKEEPDSTDEKACVFPNMAERKNVQLGGERSGLIVIGL